MFNVFLCSYVCSANHIILNVYFLKIIFAEERNLYYKNLFCLTSKFIITENVNLLAKLAKLTCM